MIMWAEKLFQSFHFGGFFVNNKMAESCTYCILKATLLRWAMNTGSVRVLLWPLLQRVMWAAAGVCAWGVIKIQEWHLERSCQWIEGCSIQVRPITGSTQSPTLFMPCSTWTANRSIHARRGSPQELSWHFERTNTNRRRVLGEWGLLETPGQWSIIAASSGRWKCLFSWWSVI